MDIKLLLGTLLFASHSITTVTGLLLLKSSVQGIENYSFESLIGVISIKFVIGLASYLIAFFISLVILSKFPLGVSISIMLPLTIISANLMGYFFLNENVSFQAVLGMTIIFIGLAFIFSDSSNHL